MSTNILCSAVMEGKENSLPNVKLPGDRIFQALSAGDQVLLLKLITEPIDYVDHPGFAKRGVEKKLFGRTAELSNAFATRFEESADSVTDAVQAGERVPSLSYEQEGHLFMRFNYARKRVADLLTENSGKKLTALSTRQLLAWGHRVLASRAVIVRLNMPLVLAMAKRTRLSSVDFNEMVSEGNMALLRSVEKFDCSRGFKFSTYSCRAILKSFSRVAMRASRYRGQFPAEFEPSMEKSDYLELQREGLERDCVDELKEILLANLAGLSDVERTVITERFAVGQIPGQDSAPKTLEQVGVLIGVTKERVRQIQNKALRKIRLALENKFLAA